METPKGREDEQRRDAWRRQGGRPRGESGRGAGRHSATSGWRPQRRHGSTPNDHAGSQLLAWRIAATATAIGLVGALVWVLLPVNRQVPLIAGVVAEYRTPLAVPAFAEEDRRLLLDLARERSSLDRGTARPIDISASLRDADAAQFRDACVRMVSSVRGGGPGADTAILYLSAIGAVDRQGHAGLVPPRLPLSGIGDADAGWLPVETLLDELEKAKPRPAKLLVVLDACRAAHGEPLGILDGSFAAAVAAEVQAKPRPGLWVLVSASPGQTACVSNAEEASLFATVFAAGLEGRADANPWGDADGRVELGELAAYLGDEVNRRAVVHHGRRQTPFVVPVIREPRLDTAIAWTVSREPREVPKGPGGGHDDDQMQWLRARWNAAERLRPRGIGERPLAWAEYEQALLRAERLTAAGAAGREQFKLAKAAVETAEKQLDEPLFAAEPLPGLRLEALARDVPAVIDRGWSEQLDAWVQGIAAGTVPAVPDTPLPPCNSRDEWFRRGQEAWTALVKLVRADAVIDEAAWRRWDALLGEPPAMSGPWPAEIQAARLLMGSADSEAWRTSAGTLLKVAILGQAAADAALAADVRADAVVSNAAPRDEADSQRRMAFDLAAIGDDLALAKASEQARQAVGKYEKTAAAADLLSRAWQTVDELRADLPWLAAWRGMAAGDRRVGIELGPLVVGLEKLERLLRAAGSPAGVGLEEIRNLHREVEEAFAPLRAAYDDSCDRLADRSAEDASTLAGITAALAVPLVTGNQRMRLLERGDEIAASLSLQPVAAARESPRLPEPDASEVAANWAAWKGGVVDPFVAAVAGEQTLPVQRPSTPAEIAAAAGAWGQVLRSQVAGLATAAASGEAAGGFAAAATERRLAVLCGVYRGGRDASASVATAEIRGKWGERLVVAAQDSMDDFFAAAHRDEPPWFIEAADACLRFAERFGHAGPQLERNRVRLDALRQGLQGWAAIQSVPDRLGTGGDEASSLIRSTLVIAPTVAEFLPRGDAALWLADAADGGVWLREKAANAKTHRILLPVGRPDASGKPRAADWRVDRDSAGAVAARKGGSLDLSAWYRGHRVVAALPVAAGGEAVPIVWRRAAPLPPRITVRGIDERRGYASFIFDCSLSMEKNTPNGQQRFNVATVAFETVLGDMAQANSWDASVWLYGHRTKWGPGPDFQPGLSPEGMRQRAVAVQSGRPFDLQPGQDVEQVLPMQPLTPVQALQVKNHLRNLQPAGETPLYLAMCRALSTDMAIVPRGEPWRIIAVTDGVNDQFKPPFTNVMDVARTLAVANNGRAVPIDVIALDLKPGAQQQAALEELKKQVRDSKGEFHDAADIEKLQQAFRAILGLARWETVDPHGAKLKAEVGGSLEIDGLEAAAPRSLEVRLEEKPATAARVVVAGGEGLELFAVRQGQPLEHRRYDGGTEQGIRAEQKDLPDPRDPRARWFVAAHLPKREGARAVRFPISIQNGDETKFSPRPAELWAEVRPEGVAGGRPYVFFDMEFEPYRPVPVIDLVVPDWPEDADQARIGVWFSMQPVEPAAVVVVEELKPGESRVFKEPRLPGITLEVTFDRLAADRGRLTVVEQHADDARDLPRLRVRLEPVCDRAEHVVEIGSASVRHVFDLPLEGGVVPKGTTLTVVDRDQLKEQTVGPAAPSGQVELLRVAVPRN